MPRKPRLVYPGAMYHVGIRGIRKQEIFRDDEDRWRFLDILTDAFRRFDTRALSYCLMGNHYHFVLRTAGPDLSTVMQRLNGRYAQAFNARHGVTGHVFESRFWAQPVLADAYFMALCPYVELNPVRASLAREPDDWAWSSHRSHVGLARAPGWLDVAALRGLVLGRDVRTSKDADEARTRYDALLAFARRFERASLDAHFAPWTSTP